MSELINRHLASKVEEALQTSRIVNIVGPRQAGKSTLVKNQLPIAEYLTMDSDSIRNSMQVDAYAMLRSITNNHKITSLPIALDEVQRVPEISLAIKRIVDEDNRKGQFLLTGSANVFDLASSGDSLAGRVHTLLLRPLSVAEIHNAGPCRLLDAVESTPETIISALPVVKQHSRTAAIELILRGG
ncbi:MAG TPA: AAA family ATPase, partial [Candidatus Obscuribacter sp.]|nr:AAA family ATPase [Candidatus Obscuribacter sp.]